MSPLKSIRNICLFPMAVAICCPSAWSQESDAAELRQICENSNTVIFSSTVLAKTGNRQDVEIASAQEADQQKRFDAFEELLSKSKLVGKFTVLGQDDRELRDEVYTIDKIEKMEKGDYWQFNARLKFEDYDFEAPIPLEVKWAGDTPVVTLTDFTIPGLGTFDSRVLFYNNKYAGTWTHGDHGGHLFGRIERQGESETEDDSKSETDNSKSKSGKSSDGTDEDK